ncbi:unnamed protein product [Vitrella brassicaformis CCMP3155]|uniref:Uncharacterized protein n=1 Tax=Vitrella brassicaformis (strain CCMP3155) TaxID=1169540 RepID=A0A0G4GUJ8_VITBC|nr:unnamed protein product [Vitrella brassicaformis CCMP3155]|eukprot:CEM34519.1 unnamed protein product [Vitrella brassicaformis CCMP3155]
MSRSSSIPVFACGSLTTSLSMRQAPTNRAQIRNEYEAASGNAVLPFDYADDYVDENNEQEAFELGPTSMDRYGTLPTWAGSHGYLRVDKHSIFFDGDNIILMAYPTMNGIIHGVVHVLDAARNVILEWRTIDAFAGKDYDPAFADKFPYQQC